ncbi:hypothetical protein HYR99_25445 [Candidatus Poribacteria bacterium]|nr:hypothetical protein [Candidatus Poribacteria bacterium]
MISARADSDWIGPKDFAVMSNHGLNPAADRHNSYAWSMAWYNGKLYIGTSRDIVCQTVALLENAGYNVTYPPSIPDMECAESVYDLDLRGEIWAYTPKTNTWELVFRSPLIEVTLNDGSVIQTARDSGYRTMIVFPEKDGSESLYVLGDTSLAIENTPNPRILRTNASMLANPDMTQRFVEIQSQAFADTTITSLRGLEIYKGNMFVAYSYDEGTNENGQRVIGAGLFMATDPASGNFVEASTKPLGGNYYNVGAFDLAVFNGYLWVGTFNPIEGFEVLRTDAVGEPPYNLERVLTNGAYRPVSENRGILNESVVSMYPFKDSLYIGSGILFGGYDFLVGNGPAPAELLRINADDSWDLICGVPRRTPYGLKLPLSGMGPGFDNIFTGYMWRMTVHDGWLYVGTMDNSIGLLYGDPSQNSELPADFLEKYLDELVSLESGFDLWKTQNGIQWFQLTRTGLGDSFSYGARSFASTERGLFLGTANPYYGCLAMLANPSGVPAPITDLRLVSTANHQVQLDWSPSSVARKYVVSRAQMIKTKEGLPVVFSRFEVIAWTDTDEFTDKTVRADQHYYYYVQVMDNLGNLSDPSNIVSVELSGIEADSALPVALSSFTGAFVDGQVILKWKTGSEWQNLGFNVYRSRTASGDSIKLNEPLIPGLGTSGSGREYQWVDDTATDGEVYYYYIEDVSLDGRTHRSDVLPVMRTDRPTVMLPKETRLFQNYPNAFNPETWIPYQLDKAADVLIRIYDVQGNLIRTLTLGHQPAGYYLDKGRAAYWDGRNQAGERVTSGTYFYQFQAEDFVSFKKMVLIK